MTKPVNIGHRRARQARGPQGRPAAHAAHHARGLTDTEQGPRATTSATSRSQARGPFHVSAVASALGGTREER